jgi:hypothetical protein
MVLLCLFLNGLIFFFNYTHNIVFFIIRPYLVLITSCAKKNDSRSRGADFGVGGGGCYFRTVKAP